MKILSDIKWWFLHRTLYRYNIIKPDLKPGYYDKDTLMVYSNFKLLVDYVEIELAYWYDALNDEDLPWYKKLCKRVKQSLNMYRNRKYGLKYLHEEGRLRDDEGNLLEQAKLAREVEELFCWWINVYPKLEKEFDEATSLEAEERIENEIDRQLVRLINVRRGLWT